MIFYKSVWACAIIALVVVFHVLSVLIKKPLSDVFAYVNIGLHIALVAVMLAAGAQLVELALLFMGSFLVFVCLNLFFGRRVNNSDFGGDGT